MRRLWKLLEALGETDAQPIANIAAVMIVVGGLFVCLQLFISSRPYTYSVQCKAPAGGDNHIVLVSRRTGITTPGPTPDAAGRAEVTSDDRFEKYDITLRGVPCRLAEAN
jgi:hypothetical protein